MSKGKAKENETQPTDGGIESPRMALEESRKRKQADAPVAEVKKKRCEGIWHVGTRVLLPWPTEEEKWFAGVVRGFNPEKQEYRVLYDDGEEMWEYFERNCLESRIVSLQHIVSQTGIQCREITAGKKSNKAAPRPDAIAVCREPERPPAHMRDAVCYRKNADAEWERRERKHPIILSRGDAWVIPLSDFFTDKELAMFDREDREQVQWKITFEYSHGGYLPFRHLNAFYASDAEILQASVSHYSHPDEGRHLFLLSHPMSELPARERKIKKLQKKFGIELNSVEEVLYRGYSAEEGMGPGTPERQDRMNMHGDGDCVLRGCPIITGCRGEGGVLMIHGRDGEELWLPTPHNTGYIMGGHDMQHLYKHSKVLTTLLQSDECVRSSVFRLMRPCQVRKDWPHHKPREFDPALNWKDLCASAIPLFKKKVGPIFFSDVHPLVMQMNRHLITRSGYPLRFGPGDEFANTTALQLFHLHPEPQGSGISGQHICCSLLLAGKMKDSVKLIDKKHVRVKYLVDAKSKKLDVLLMAMRNRTPVRVFLSAECPYRSLFPGKGVLYLSDAFVKALRTTATLEQHFVLEGSVTGVVAK